MPLPANRSTLEWSLRLLAAAAMTWLVIGAFSRREKAGGRVVDGRGLEAALPEWVSNPPAETLGLRLAGSLDRKNRDYLRAIRGNTTVIAWADAGIASIMLDGETLQDPAGGAVARITGEDDGAVALSDSLGLLDTLEIIEGGMTVRVSAFSGMLAARAGTTTANWEPARFLPGRSVVVIGMAGWESKFTIRALEERGWKVESRIALAPRLATIQGRPFPLDTARHATVIALDSSAAPYAQQIQQFVRSGGGLILGEAASRSLPASAPASVASLVRPVRLTPVDTDFRRRLVFRALSRLREGAVRLEEVNGEVAMAAWRMGSGRVVQVGYRDIWRWRMEGGENAVTEHRNWWAGLVATTAYRSLERQEAPVTPAPLASFIQEFGPPASLPSTGSSATVWPILLSIFLGSLALEWLSRRLRGLA